MEGRFIIVCLKENAHGKTICMAVEEADNEGIIKVFETYEEAEQLARQHSFVKASLAYIIDLEMNDPFDAY